MTNSIRLQPGGILKGEYIPPGDKSISHRAVMIGALADGESHFTHFLQSEDCLHTLQAFQKLGVQAQVDETSGSLTVRGVGLRGLKSNSESSEIYVGNSGTSMRLLLGILAGQKMEVTLTGDDSLSKRPMKRVTEPLKQMGAQIKGGDKGNYAPLTLRGGKLKGIHFENKHGSAQVKSCLMFAGMNAEGETIIEEPFPSRDHTERMLKAAGASFAWEENRIKMNFVEKLSPLNMKIPGDISSAAFFIVGAAIQPDSEVVIKDVGLNEKRIGLLKVLERMGAQIEVRLDQEDPEPIGEITVRGARLRGTRIVKEEIPSLIDELPILMIAMALAEGESLVSGAEELRVKESDRIACMVKNLKAVGGESEELPDGCLIKGVASFEGGSIEAFGDHRTVMSFAIASLRSEEEIEIDDISSVATSFPSFFDHFQALRESPATQ